MNPHSFVSPTTAIPGPFVHAGVANSTIGVLRVRGSRARTQLEGCIYAYHLLLWTLGDCRGAHRDPWLAGVRYIPHNKVGIVEKFWSHKGS